MKSKFCAFLLFLCSYHKTRHKRKKQSNLNELIFYSDDVHIFINLPSNLNFPIENQKTLLKFLEDLEFPILTFIKELNVPLDLNLINFISNICQISDQLIIQDDELFGILNHGIAIPISKITLIETITDLFCINFEINPNSFYKYYFDKYSICKDYHFKSRNKVHQLYWNSIHKNIGSISRPFLQRPVINKCFDNPFDHELNLINNKYYLLFSDVNLFINAKLYNQPNFEERHNYHQNKQIFENIGINTRNNRIQIFILNHKITLKINDKIRDWDDHYLSKGLYLFDEFYFIINNIYENYFQIIIDHKFYYILIGVKNNKINKLCLQANNKYSPSSGLLTIDTGSGTATGTGTNQINERDISKLFQNYLIDIYDCNQINLLECYYSENNYFQSKLKTQQISALHSKTGINNRINILFEGRLFGSSISSMVSQKFIEHICFHDKFNCFLISTNDGQFKDREWNSLIVNNNFIVNKRFDMVIWNGNPIDFKYRNTQSPHIVIYPSNYGEIPIQQIEYMKKQFVEIWVPSQYNADLFRNAGFPSNQIYKISHGIDRTIFNQDIEPYQKFKTRKTFKFLFVGRDAPREGVDVLLDSYLASFTSQDDVSLIIVFLHSQVFQLKRIKKLIYENEFNNNKYPDIELFTDYKNTHELLSIYRSADYLIHPFRSEAFCLTSLEAMSMGIPIVIPKVPPATELTDDTNSVYINATQKYCFDYPCGEKTIFELETYNQPWWYEPNKLQLTQTMSKIYKNRHRYAKKKIISGVQKAQKANWDIVGINLKNRIFEIFKT
ncbi:hypothetical protein M0813_29524 [Anaeramoeba flamelloides]|uniref:Glycosyl transferase family 1 domain-containing protein n=1 Tax=Anaeramoeba flamelloides TaxID=1746091 RepID=A0ABQ8XMN1_9EUKA|nr:hypothetical protein M0813_29524 [Anaeramoeba flamelloides]